jgi:hypothetical protein
MLYPPHVILLGWHPEWFYIQEKSLPMYTFVPMEKPT